MALPRHYESATPDLPATDDYRPLAGLAIASIMVAGLYALLMIVVAVVALTKGIPLFMSLATLLIPMGGALLAILARGQIRKSEGSRGGLALTKWALWLSVFFGLGYLAYYIGTRAAVTQQAKQFTTRFLDTLRKGDVNRAFIDTLVPLQRKGLNVTDLERFAIPSGRRDGPLTQFRQLDIVRALSEWKQDAQVTLLGVKNWTYDRGGYIVLLTYRIETPESDSEYDIAVMSAEGPELDGRQWQVVRERLLAATRTKPTPLGETAERWKQQARVFAGEWLRKRYNGNTLGAFLDTLPPKERDARQREFIAASLSGLAATPSNGMANLLSQLPAHQRVSLFMPAYHDYVSGKLLSFDKFLVPQQFRDDILSAIRREFAHPVWISVRLGEKKPRVQIVDKVNGPVRVFEEFEMAILPPDATIYSNPKYTIDMGLVIESDAGSLSPDHQPEWRIVSIPLIRGAPPSADPDRQLQ